MMKLSRTSWLILGIGIFIIAVGSLFMVYRGQVAKQQELNNKIAQAQATLPALVSERQDLEGQFTKLEGDLAQATSLLDTAKAKFPKSVDSIEYDEVLFKIADDFDLEITSLKAAEPDSEEVGGVIYTVTRFQVVVRGEVDGVLDFVDTLVTSGNFTSTAGEPVDFTTANVELVDITVPEPLNEDEIAELTNEEIEELKAPSALIEIIIYSYEGE